MWPTPFPHLALWFHEWLFSFVCVFVGKYWFYSKPFLGSSPSVLGLSSLWWQIWLWRRAEATETVGTVERRRAAIKITFILMDDTQSHWSHIETCPVENSTHLISKTSTQTALQNFIQLSLWALVKQSLAICFTGGCFCTFLLSVLSFKSNPTPLTECYLKSDHPKMCW